MKEKTGIGMPKIICYPISCSSDEEVDIRRLFVWGELGSARWLPITKEEAKRRMLKCREREKCNHCDAQIHRVEISRTKMTNMQRLRKGSKPEKECQSK